MSDIRLIGAIVVGAACLVLASLAATAATVTSTGTGSAVTTVDRAATFDRLDYTHNGTPLSDYTEGLLFISTDGDSTVGLGPAQQPPFNPFHTALDPATQAFFFPDWGNTVPVVIRTTDGKPVYGVEFLYGNGWTTGDIYGVPWGNSTAWLEWQTLKGTTVVSSGTIGQSGALPVGTVVGWYDPDGFDELHVSCKVANPSPPNFQELALDDVRVQLSPNAPLIAADAVRALQIASGLLASDGADVHRLDVTGDLVIRTDDAAQILRTTLGL